MSQRFQVPADGAPYLSFSYRIFSYDELYNDEFDHFDVYIDDLSDDAAPFLILRDGSTDGKPTGNQDGCIFAPDDKGWIARTWSMSSVVDLGVPPQTHDLRGKTIELSFYNYSKEPGRNNAWYNTWVYIDDIRLQRSMTLQKTSTSSDPVHEGTRITYTISYANTSLVAQTMTLTDPLPANTVLIPESISPQAQQDGSTLIWDIGELPPGVSGQVSFAVQVPLIPGLGSQPFSAQLTTAEGEPYVIPNTITCDSTRFWMVGLQVDEPPEPPPAPGWNDVCVSHRTEITGVGMGSPSVITNPQTIALPAPAEVGWLLGQVAGRAPAPDGVTFTTDAPQSLTVTAPGHDGPASYTFETELQPAGQITAAVSAGDDSVRALILYSKRATSGAWTSVGRTTNGFVYQGDGPEVYREVLDFPPLEQTADLSVTAVIIDNDADARPLSIEATAGGVSDGATFTHPTEGDLLNIAHLTLPGVPAGADQVVVTLRSPPDDHGDSGALVGVNASYQCPAPANAYTVHVEIPPGERPTEAWILVREQPGVFPAPGVDGLPAQRVSGTPPAGASIWSAAITPAMIERGSLAISTNYPQQLNAVLLFAGDPPFERRAMTETTALSYTQVFTFDVPSATEGELNVLYPVLDVLDHGQMTTVTVEFDGDSVTKRFNQPNMNPGLTVIPFPFDLRKLDSAVEERPVAISLESEDSYVWSLGPRVCRPVYVKNTAWLCSDQAGCITTWDEITPPGFAPPAVFFPVILKGATP